MSDINFRQDAVERSVKRVEGLQRQAFWTMQNPSLDLRWWDETTILCNSALFCYPHLDPEVYPPYNCEGGHYVFQSSAAWVFPRGPEAEIWGTVRSWRDLKAVITAIHDLKALENIKSIYENTSILDAGSFKMMFKILLLNYKRLKSGEWKCFQAGLTMWRPIQRLLQGSGSWVGGQVWKPTKCHTFLMPFRGYLRYHDMQRNGTIYLEYLGTGDMAIRRGKGFCELSMVWISGLLLAINHDALCSFLDLSYLVLCHCIWQILQIYCIIYGTVFVY